MLRALYHRAATAAPDGSGACAVNGGERSLREQVGLTEKTIRGVLATLDAAGEITDVTPGEPGDARRKAHRAAGGQNTYRLRDRRPRGSRKRRKEGGNDLTGTGETTGTHTGETPGTYRSTGSFGTGETTASTTNEVRLGTEQPPLGLLRTVKDTIFPAEDDADSAATSVRVTALAETDDGKRPSPDKPMHNFDRPRLNPLRGWPRGSASPIRSVPLIRNFRQAQAKRFTSAPGMILLGRQALSGLPRGA